MRQVQHNDDMRRVPPNPLPEQGPALRALPEAEPVPAAPRPAPSVPPAGPPGAGAPVPAPRVTPLPTPSPAPPPMPRTTPLRPEDLGFALADDGARVLVTRVERGSAASISGLQLGDTLLFIDGRPVEAAVDLLLAFSASRPGREYGITVRRSAQVLELVLVAPR